MSQGENALEIVLNEKDLVTKSNKINEAHYRLTSNEQKLILAMISLIKPDDEDFKAYRIKISDFMNLLEIEHKGTYKQAKIITKSLMEKVLEIKEPEGLLQVSWFSSIRYYDGKGYVDLHFDPNLKPYLLGLKDRFLSYRLKNVVQLKSAYSIRIYELLKQYEKIGKRSFKVDELREILGITTSEYKNYNDFKKKVILISQRELKSNTDLAFEFKEVKTGRKITDLEFTIIKKEVKEKEAVEVNFDLIDLDISKLQEYEKELFDKLQKFYLLSRGQAHEIVTVILPKEGSEYVEQLLSYCSVYYERKKKEDSNSSLGAVTYKAFKEGWQVQASLFDQEQEQKQQEELKKKQEAEAKEKEEQAQEEKINQQVEEIIKTLSTEEIEKTFPLWLKGNQNFIYSHSYKPNMTAQEIKQKSGLAVFLNLYVREKYLKETPTL